MEPGFIGDVILVSPLLTSLRAAFPDAVLAMLVRPDRACLAQAIPAVDEVIVFDKRGEDSGLRGLLRMASVLKKRDFDMLLAPHRSHRTALLAYMSGIPVRVGFKLWLGRMFYKPAVAFVRQEPCRLEQEFCLLRAVDVEPVTTKPSLKPPADVIRYASDFMDKRNIDSETCIGFCLGANWPTKRWPGFRFAQLAAMLLDEGFTPLLFGGPGDEDLENTVQKEFSKIHSGKIPSCVGNDLLQAMGLLAVCAAVVGGDTGLVHMARAVDAPVVIMYGPTDERLHHHHGNERVLVADVSCRPCHRHGQMRCPAEHHDCMRAISPQMVYRALMGLLDVNEK